MSKANANYYPRYMEHGKNGTHKIYKTNLLSSTQLLLNYIIKSSKLNLRCSLGPVTLLSLIITKLAIAILFHGSAEVKKPPIV